MRRYSSLLSLPLLALLAVPHPAQARPPSTGRFQLGAALMYTISLEANEPLNPWGLGLGARAGYTTSGGLYLGALADIHLGESEQVGPAEVSQTGHFLAGAIGYDIPLGRPALLRPYLSLGAHIHTLSTEIGSTTTSTTEEDFFLGPGLDLLFFLGRIYLGPQVRLNVVFDDRTLVSCPLAFTVGFTF